MEFSICTQKIHKLEQKKSLKQLEGLVMNEEDRNEIQEEVVVMEKGIDKERERDREIDKGTIIVDGFTWDFFTHQLNLTQI
jgi:hypothetical protein